MFQSPTIHNLPHGARAVGGQAQEFIRLPKGCDRFDLSRSTVYRAFESGDLTKYKLGSAVYLDLTEVRRWITGKANKDA